MLTLPKLRELSFLVYGLGISGQSVVKFLKKNKFNDFKVWDDNQKKLFKKYQTLNLKKTLAKVDYIILSPGISLLKNEKLNKYKKKIITDIDLLYLSKNNFKSIVVTGTNGKSTTCKLLAHLLKKNKIKHSLGGNIGNPVLDLKIFKNSFVIIEASSFQLSHSKFIRPDFAFFLNFTNDHLDWHGSMNKYLNSKLKIFRLQQKSDYALAHDQFRKIFKKRNYLGKFISPKYYLYKNIKNKINNSYLTSCINDENMSYVYSFAKLIRIKKKHFINAINSFTGLPHRFEIFFKRKNITFINDSKATSFVATRTALSGLKNIYWILGGLPKKGDKIRLSKYKKNINKCYLIGKNIHFFKNQIEGKVIFSITRNLKNSIIQILRDINLQDSSKKFVLLSPAAASFDQYDNFEKRGDEFKRLCRIYGRKFI